MSDSAPFAVASDGAAIAAGDGPELFCWRGDGHPLWKQFTDGILVGVGVGPDAVVTVDTDGRLCRWRRNDGELLDSVMVRGAPLGLVVARDGTACVVTADGPVLVGPGGPPRPIPMPGTTCAGFGPDASSLGVGQADGSFVAVETTSGSAWGRCALPGPVGGVAWSALGGWVVGAGTSLCRVSGDGATRQVELPGQGGPVGPVATSDNGLIAAARVGPRIAIYELHGNKAIGDLVVRRSVGGLCFGPGSHLGIGLDDADATVVELVTGAAIRTEPHPGRARNTWRLENRVDGGAIRGAFVLHQAGGQPIARYIPPPVREEAAEGGGRGCFASCLASLGFVVFMTLFCGGVMGLMYVLKTYDLWQYLPLR